jgi:hypothetical protein
MAGDGAVLLPALALNEAGEREKAAIICSVSEREEDGNL